MKKEMQNYIDKLIKTQDWDSMAELYTNINSYRKKHGIGENSLCEYLVNHEQKNEINEFSLWLFENKEENSNELFLKKLFETGISSSQNTVFEYAVNEKQIEFAKFLTKKRTKEMDILEEKALKNNDNKMYYNLKSNHGKFDFFNCYLENYEKTFLIKSKNKVIGKEINEENLNNKNYNVEKILSKSSSGALQPNWIDVAGTEYQNKWIIDPTIQIVKTQGNVISSRFCSGFMIDIANDLGINLLLTAGHCVGDVCYKNPKDYDTSNLKISFSYQFPKYDSQNKIGSGEIKEDLYDFSLVEHGTCCNYDYAIMKVQDLNPNKYGAVNLEEGDSPKDGAELVIAQHPDGIPKKIAKGQLKQTNKEGLLEYNIDTQPGSSGSPVGNLATNKVVAVHIKSNATNNCGLPVKKIFEESNVLKKIKILKEEIKPLQESIKNLREKESVKVLKNLNVFSDTSKHLHINTSNLYDLNIEI